MKSTLIPFGLRDGLLVRAVEVANGLACGCLCPGCKTSLIAANKGLKNIPHFRHSTSVDCRAGYESSLHKVAKNLLLERMCIMAPAFEKTISLMTDFGHRVYKSVKLNEALLKADRALTEFSFEGVTPDIVFEIGAHKLLIEICVSRKVDFDRYSSLRALGISTIEIDLSSMEMRTICDPLLFEQQLIHDLSNKRWIHSNRGAQMESEAMQQIKKDVIAMNLAFHGEAELTEKTRQLGGISSREGDTFRLIRGSEAGGGSRTYEVQNVRIDKADLRKKILARAESIAKSIQLSVKEWGGKAMQCNTCLMANPPESTNCRHCMAPVNLQSISYTNDYANTALARLKCSPRVDQSVERVPVLTFVNEETGELMEEPKQ